MHFCDNFYKISKSTFFLQSTLGRFSRKMNLQERYVNVQKLDFVISSSYFFFSIREVLICRKLFQKEIDK